MSYDDINLPPLPKASKMYDIPGYDEEELKDYARTAIQADRARRAAQAPAASAEPLTETYVQTVPDKCDRIVWRGSYYHLPLRAVAQEPVASIKTLARYEPDTVYIGTGEYIAECVRADDGDYYLAADADAAIEALLEERDQLAAENARLRSILIDLKDWDCDVSGGFLSIPLYLRRRMQEAIDAAIQRESGRQG